MAMYTLVDYIYKIFFSSGKFFVKDRIEQNEIKEINAYDIGILARNLGAGRLSKEDEIDHSVGIVLEKSVGDKVNIGDILCKLYVNKKSIYTVKEVLDSFIIE